MLFVVDAVINLVLGVLLLAYSPVLAIALGVPLVESAFYPNILGAVFIGIAIALIISAVGSQTNSHAGLGFFGAIGINLCVGTALALWLIFGTFGLPLRGLLFLWSLVGLLVVVSSFELVSAIVSKM